MLRLAALLLLLPRLVQADPVTLRMAAIAPDGTSWARELKAWARAIESGTGGAVRVKWYLGGIAGDEVVALERVKRGQLDGAAGALMCEQLSPTLRVLRVPGLLQGREEALYVLNQLHAQIAAEMSKSGYVYQGAAGFGLDIIMSREPVASLADLRKQRLWLRDHDDVLHQALTAMGLRIVTVPIHEAGDAYEANRLDAFVASPASGLAFQWVSRARAYTDVKIAYLVGCLAITNRIWDQLPRLAKEELLTQSAVLASRFEAVGRDVDQQLLERLFVRQGLARVPVSEAFARELAAAELDARRSIDPQLVPPALLQRVTELVDDFRRTQAGPKR